jgi:hypothetical protein
VTADAHTIRAAAVARRWKGSVMTSQDAATGRASTPHVRSLGDAAAAAVAVIRADWSARRERLWLGLIAVPLAMTASGLVGLWWPWPALLVGAWACMRSWHWLWLLALELGVVGVVWGVVGATYLAKYPDDRPVTAVAWMAVPLALSGGGLRNRRLHNHRRSAGQLHDGARSTRR